MRAHYTDTVDKAVCTEESGASRLEAVLVALVERKARALHAEQSRTHPLLLLLRHLPDEETSIIGSPSEELPSHWCEHEIARHKRKKLKLQTQRNKERGPEQQEVDRRRKRRRRRKQAPDQPPRKHRTLLVSAIDEQAKVIHVLDPDELPRRARYTIMVTACLLLFLCLLLVGVTLRMAPLIDDMGKWIIALPVSARHFHRYIFLSAAGERAHDARRPAGGSLKSHPVVGGIALTPRYSPRPRLDNIRPAAAPPEPVESEPPPDPRPEPRLGALLAVSHPTLLQPLWTLGKSASTTSQSAGQHTTTSPNPERAVSLAASALPVLQSTLEMSTHSISTLSSPHGHALLLALTQPASAPSTPVSPSTETKSVVSMLYSPVQDVSDTSTLQDSALAVSDLPTTQISLQLSSVSSPS